ncbi:hypothetical protein M3Y99_01454400 [Aphelenchoides fujianensis]|nr:hypothetical protein M3Y99_01454400 [Aphelenchoides fujianensis]
MSEGARQRRKTTGSKDFVSSDVNQALQEARRVVSNEKKTDKQNENLIEEHTTVQVRNSGKKSDPFEVFISHSTITRNDSEEDLFGSGSLSDSDLPRSPRHSCSRLRKTAAGSETNVLVAANQSKHTNVRYRRKHDKFWTRDDDDAKDTQTDDTQSDEEDAAPARDRRERGTWEARWTVQSFEQLPEWLQDNEYLLSGHRPPLPSVSECFKSIWAIHTETGNIWTHLIGAIAFFLLYCWHLSNSDIGFQEKVVFSFFFVGAVLCLGLSFAFHTLSCHSITALSIFSKLDYMGISLLIIGSFIPHVYYGKLSSFMHSFDCYYCRPSAQITYITMICVLGIAAIVVSLWDKFNQRQFRAFRAGVFVTMGLSGVIPAIHYIYTDGFQRLVEENGFYWLLTMALLYLFGALLYATRTPERFWPGKFDICSN